MADFPGLSRAGCPPISGSIYAPRFEISFRETFFQLYFRLLLLRSPTGFDLKSAQTVPVGETAKRQSPKSVAVLYVGALIMMGTFWWIGHSMRHPTATSTVLYIALVLAGSVGWPLLIVKWKRTKPAEKIFY